MAAIAAGAADASARPGIALGSSVLHRLAVAGCILAVAYAVVMVLWLAYHGRWVSMQLPGLGGGVQPAEEIDDAVHELDELRSDTQSFLDAHEDALTQLRRRVAALENRGGGEACPDSSRPTAA